MRQHAQDGVEDLVDILGEEPQHEIAMLLEQRVFAPVPAMGAPVSQMLRVVGR